MFGTKRRRLQREAFEQPFPEHWRPILSSNWPLWNSLTDEARERLEELTKVFVAERRWESARGFELTEPMKVLIAAQACLLILELDEDYFRHVSVIIVHPTTVVLQGPRASDISGMVSDGPQPILGQATDRGPVVLAWDAVAFDARHPARGQNVVFHEFAHKLDMLDGVIDGTPPLPDDDARRRWIDVCTREFTALSAGLADPLLRDYGAEDPGEFFAVATEVFFCRPVEMRETKPELYEVLSGFYRQDPAARLSKPLDGSGESLPASL